MGGMTRKESFRNMSKMLHRNKLDTWGKWKRESIRFHDRRSSEYLHNKSSYEKLSDELKKAKIMSKLPWDKRWAIKGLALHGKVNRHAESILSSMGESAAHISSDTSEEAMFDLATSVIGGWLKGLKAIQLAKIGKSTPMKSEIFKALQEVHRAAGFPEIASRAAKAHRAKQIASRSAKVHRAREIVRADVVDKGIDGVHSVHSYERAITKNPSTKEALRKLYRPFQGSYQLPHREPLPNIASQIRVDLPKARKSIKRKLPPLKKIKGLPKFKEGFVPGPDIGDIFKSKYMDKMKKHTGWGLEINRSRRANTLRNMRQQGNRFRPLTPQPVQKRISAPPMRPFQSNPLRQMSQGLMNQNRARPVFR